MRTAGRPIWPLVVAGVVAAAVVVVAFVTGWMPLALIGPALLAASVWEVYRPREAPATAEPDLKRESAPLATVSQDVEQEPSPVAERPRTRRVPPSVDPEVVLRVLLDEVAELGRAVATHLWLADEASGTLRLVCASGPMAPTAQPVALDGDDVRARSWTEESALLAPVLRVREGKDESTIWRYALPVTAGDARGVAAVDVASVSEPDAGALAEITAGLRGSLAGALGLHVAKMELRVAQGLVDAARELSRMLDPDALLKTALGRAMELSQAQTGSVMLLDDASGKLVIAVAEGLPADVIGSTALSEGEGIAGWVLACGRSLLIEDLPARRSTSRRHGVRSAVSVPIADDDGVLGVLNVGSRSFPARFSESHLAALEVLARQTATALRNARAAVESRELYVDTVRALVLALETKDPYARGGTDRVVEHAEVLAEALSLGEDEAEALRIAALLHDIGMVTVNSAIAAADRPLTTVESGLLKMHPQVAADVLAEARALRQVVPLVYHHHEWYDGHGYLEGVAGEDIPLGARILAVADAFVAMTSERPYRRALSERDAIRELEEKAGTQFDPLVVEAMVGALRRGRNRVPGKNDERS